MNVSETKMLDLLKRGKDEFGVVSVKAEFEAEGTRPDELLRLLELAHRANLGVTLKIGGCEAISDLHACLLYGVDYVIAPMVETPYALRKFIEAKDKIFGANEGGTAFLFNVETRTTLDNIEAMIAAAKDKLDGVVFGRVDFTMSCDRNRSAINSPDITKAVVKVAQQAAKAGLELVVGGGVSDEAIPVLGEIRKTLLTRFETRKIVFDAELLDGSRAEAAIANAVVFELEWLKNKRSYYTTIADEDNARIAMIEGRLAVATAA